MFHPISRHLEVGLKKLGCASFFNPLLSVWMSDETLFVVLDTAISRKVVGKKVHATIPKGNMGYDQYTVPDTVAVEPTFVAFL